MPPLSVTSRWLSMRSITGCGRGRVELGRVGAGQAELVAGELDGHDLHAEAQAEARDAVLAGVVGGRDLALDAPLAEPAGDHDAVEVAQPALGQQALDVLGLDPLDARRWAPWWNPPCLSASTTDR